MHTPQLRMRTLPRGRVALTLNTRTAAASTRTELSFEQARRLAVGLAEPGHHWCEDAWLLRRSPEGRWLRLTFYRQVWSFSLTTSIELTADDARNLATDLSRWLSQCEPSVRRSPTTGLPTRMHHLLSIHRT